VLERARERVSERERREREGGERERERERREREPFLKRRKKFFWLSRLLNVVHTLRVKTV
jgi:Zn-finger nucleic acid-binding protein